MTASSVALGPLDTDTGVRLRGVEKVFRSRRSTVQALSSVDLEIRSGEFVTLFGPSGCGKSTVLRIIAGLERETSGEVSVFGTSPAEASKRKNIAWIPQSSALLPWLSVKANASLSNVVNRRPDRNGTTSRTPLDPVQLLGEVGLSDFLGAKPNQLSGGMRQRASIARGFVQGAELMLMDEPFSALDELTKDALQLRLLEVWSQHRKTIVFVTHSVNEAVLLSDRIVVMTPRPGRIQGVVDITLPRENRPELAGTPEFTALVDEVKQVLRTGWEGER
ncbi:ABC transporter ATP-binding protein [Nocardioides sp. zg-536]|uniref:ABC transporter ATP-binding protein n=1 Tax=Nocardioides faecalis TaxID=2803858 RepID=A0A938Y158_9ACTN|nr:ABC transporter ATP-binding protein [Nocardioides faecalis]MBM9459991.1 ABC transporter ATP-binding protein [Nocardioides faecalis]QVI58788.1 ABC transporter ATP-binding protein [Nocardioides faecalis]